MEWYKTPLQLQEQNRMQSYYHKKYGTKKVKISLRDKIIYDFAHDLLPYIKKYDFHLRGKTKTYLDRDHCSSITHLTELPNGKIVGADDRHYCVKVWNPKNGYCEAMLKGHTKHIKVISHYYKDNKLMMVTGSCDGVIKIWDMNTYECVRTLTLDNEEITTLTIHKIKGRYKIVIGSNKGKIRLWNTYTERYDGKVYKHFYEDNIGCIQFLDNNKFISGSEGPLLYLWDIRKNTYLFEIDTRTQNYTICIAPDKNIIGRYEDTKVVIIDSSQKKIDVILDRHHDGRIYNIIFNEGLIMVVFNDMTLDIWDYETAEWIRSYKFESDINTVCKLPNNDVAVKVETDIIILRDGEIIQKIPNIRRGDQMVPLSDNRVIIYSGCDIGIFE